jgi:hypothetical protein
MSANNWTWCPKCQADDGIYVDGREQFREDYEFWGAKDGVVKWSYSGHCGECGLGVDFQGERKFWP